MSLPVDCRKHLLGQLAKRVGHQRRNSVADLLELLPLAALEHKAVMERLEAGGFLKFLIPKLKVKDPDQDKLDELLNSIDLSTYGLERSRLEVKIGLDASETELEPQNPNVRGGHFGDGDKDPLDEIVRAFNERHFVGWEATPEEQRVKFINIAKHVVAHADYKAQVDDNPDAQNRQLALEKLIQLAISAERRRELDLYKRYASDPDFKRAFDASISRLLASQDALRTF